ncbi:hypothetical protein COLINT_02615 [Collinsella intestinalis DSM 13280]|uniref:Uncharacterized protein n=1 Tax=Collinsella intestinalis DSM 13280 TaxID=521003 RepID=C4F983_9ACTN|nr:hypothetical protein COLINT_02615 [Collinsella intestinalis DSM 13280]
MACVLPMCNLGTGAFCTWRNVAPCIQIQLKRPTVGAFNRYEKGPVTGA